MRENQTLWFCEGVCVHHVEEACSGDLPGWRVLLLLIFLQQILAFATCQSTYLEFRSLRNLTEDVHPHLVLHSLWQYTLLFCGLVWRYKYWLSPYMTINYLFNQGKIKRLVIHILNFTPWEKRWWMPSLCLRSRCSPALVARTSSARMERPQNTIFSWWQAHPGSHRWFCRKHPEE